MGLYIKDEDPRLNLMWENLRSKNLNLFNIIVDTARFITKVLKKDCIVTEIYRSKEEQENIYGKGTKRVSPHMLWHAVDLRSFVFTKEEKDQICEYINNKYGSHNYYKITAFYHEVNGHGEHFHVQFIQRTN